MRKPVNKVRSARSFRSKAKKTHSRNVKRPGRGGYRL